MRDSPQGAASRTPERVVSAHPRLSVHHIGGRAGNRSFPIVPRFEADIINVLYDADPDCIRQIELSNRGLGSELHVYPYCIGGRCESLEFRINADPFTSSVLPTNPDYGAYYHFCADHDQLWGDVSRSAEVRRVDAVSMDHIFGAGLNPTPPPDFLSIDVQGAAYDVLAGSVRTLRSNVLALVVEAEFHPLYRGQRLFGDVCELLAGNGFLFARFLNLIELSPHRAPVGMRGDGFQVSCDALFLRSTESIEEHAGDDTTRSLMLHKLAFIAIVLSQFEYGMKCLEAAGTRHDHIPVPGLEEMSYYRFLKRLEGAARKMPRSYPPTFPEKYNLAASKARFDESTPVEIVRGEGRLRRFLNERTPLLFLHLRAAKRALWACWAGGMPSEVEALLLEYGLFNQAATVMGRRRAQRPAARSAASR